MNMFNAIEYFNHYRLKENKDNSDLCQIDHILLLRASTLLKKGMFMLEIAEFISNCEKEQRYKLCNINTMECIFNASNNISSRFRLYGADARFIWFLGTKFESNGDIEFIPAIKTWFRPIVLGINQGISRDDFIAVF